MEFKLVLAFILLFYFISLKNETFKDDLKKKKISFIIRLPLRIRETTFLAPIL
jgi:hypothetical protein